jgi:hypothetical protein
LEDNMTAEAPAKKSWYDTGYDGVDREKERIARLSGPNRFWMKEGTKREIVFIDDDPICLYEHNPKLNGKWTNWFTCLKDSSDIVPCCEKLGERSRYYVGYYTIVDLTEHTDAKGNKYRYEVKLLPAKLKTLQLLRRKKQDRGSLIGCIFNVHRDSREDPNCGGEFEFQREAKLDGLLNLANYKGKKLTELYTESADKSDVLARLKETFQLSLDKDKGLIVPKIYSFNYYKLLAPKDPKEIRSVLGGATIDSGGGENTSEGGSDDDVPF